MADGYFERGEIYWVRLGDGFTDIPVTRPGLIVSTNEVNKSGQVLVAFTTTREGHNSWGVATDVTGKPSVIKCDNITAVNTNRLGKLMGVLSEFEMRQVENALEEVFDLGYVDDAQLKEKDREISARDAVIAEKDAEIAKLKAALANAAVEKENAELSLKVEGAMWQKLYEKALTQVVDMKYTNDLFLKDHLGRKEEPPKVAPVAVEAPVVAEQPPVVEPVVPAAEPPVKKPKAELVDINHSTITELKKLGFSLSMAHSIVARRPFNSVEDIKKVPGMKTTQYRVMAPKLCCTPVEKKADPGYEAEETPVAVAEAEVVSGKVNINTATANDLRRVGIATNPAYAIVNYRKANGSFENIDDLLNVPHCGKIFLSRHRDKFEV